MSRSQVEQAGEPLTVRRLGPDDAAAWAALRKEALESHPLAFGASVPDDPAVLAEQFLERVAPAEEAAIFGAFVGPSMVGMVAVRRHAGLKERHKVYLWGMYVSEGARRRGAGRMLVEQAIAQSRAWQGAEQILLGVSDVATDARRLYERCGFVAWGREPRALRWDGRSVDETHMVLDLRGASGRRAPAGEGE